MLERVAAILTTVGLAAMVTGCTKEDGDAGSTSEGAADSTFGMSSGYIDSTTSEPGAALRCPALLREDACVELAPDDDGDDGGTMDTPLDELCAETPPDALAALHVERCEQAVCGALDPDIIRRIVRAHQQELLDCYSAGFCEDPELEGRVIVEFTITGDGAVGPAALQSTTLADDAVARCMLKAVRSWTFPRPRGGGTVNVIAPFLLTSG